MANLPSSGTTGSIDNFGVTRDQFRDGMASLLDYIAESLGGVTSGGYGTQTVSSSSLILSSGATLAANPADNSVDTKLVTAQWVKENAIHIGTSAPSPAVEGHLWLDTTNGLKYNSGTAASPSWSQVAITALDDVTLNGDAQVAERLRFPGTGQFILPAGTDAEFNTFFSGSVSPAEGSLRYNSTSSTLQFYSNQWNDVSVTTTTVTISRINLVQGTLPAFGIDSRLTYRTTSALKFSNNFAFGFNGNGWSQLNLNEHQLFDSSLTMNWWTGHGFHQGTGRTWGRGNWLTVTGQVYRWGKNNWNAQYDAPSHGSEGYGNASGTQAIYGNNAKQSLIRVNASTRREQFATVLGLGTTTNRTTTRQEKTTNEWDIHNGNIWIKDLFPQVGLGSRDTFKRQRGKSIVPHIDTPNNNFTAYDNYFPLTSPHPRIIRSYIGECVSYYLDDAGRVYFAGHIGQGNAGDGVSKTIGTYDNYPYFRQVFFYDHAATDTNGNPAPLADSPYIFSVASSQLSEGETGAGISWNYRYTTNYALDIEGYVYSWGYNGYGQLGDATGTDNAYARRMNPAYFNNKRIRFITCAGGLYTSVFAIDEDGDVWAWGYNGLGQLGLSNATTYYATPQNISELNNPNPGQNPPADSFSSEHIQHVMCAGYTSSTHAITYFLTSGGRVFACGRATNFGCYMGVHHDTAGGDMNIMTPTRLRVRKNYVDAANPGTLEPVVWNSNESTFDEETNNYNYVTALYHSGGANGTTYAFVKQGSTWNPTDTSSWRHQGHPVNTVRVFSWGNNASGQLGRSTNHTAPTSVAEVALSGSGATNSRIDNWLSPLEIRFKDYGIPEIADNYRNTGPLTAGDTWASRQGTAAGNLTWYSPYTTNAGHVEANPNLTSTYKHPDEDQSTGKNYIDSLPTPDWDNNIVNTSNAVATMMVPAPYDDRNDDQNNNQGNMVFAQPVAIYGNGTMTETNQTVVLLMSNGQLYWVGENGLSTAGYQPIDAWCDGGIATGNDDNSNNAHTLTGEGSAGEVNYGVYFSPIKLQPEPARDFQFYSTNGSYANNSTKYLQAYGHRYGMVGYSGTVYVSSYNDTTSLSVTGNSHSYFEAISKTQSALNTISYNHY